MPESAYTGSVLALSSWKDKTIELLPLFLDIFI